MRVFQENAKIKTDYRKYVLISRIFITNSIQIKCNKKLFHAISDDISEAIDNVAKKTNAEIDSIENDKKIIAIMLTTISALI